MLQTALVLGLIIGILALIFFWFLKSDKDSADEEGTAIIGGVGFLLEFICIPSLIFLPADYRIGFEASMYNIGILMMYLFAIVAGLLILAVILYGLYTIAKAIDILSGYRLSDALENLTKNVKKGIKNGN